MKRFSFMSMLVLFAFALVQPVAAGEREDALLSDLLGFGSRALQAQVEKRQEARAGEAAAGQANHASAAIAAPLQQTFSEVLRQSIDGAIEQYKEQYKEEGRAYAKELGDMIVERVNTSSKIGELLARAEKALVTAEALCWFVIVYLTIVTLIMLVSLLHLKRANARILAELETLKNGP